MLAADADEVKTPKKSSRQGGCKRHIENETTLGELPIEPLPKASQPKRLKRGKEAAAQEPIEKVKIDEAKEAPKAEAKKEAPKPEEKKEEKDVNIVAAAKEAPKADSKREVPKPEEKKEEKAPKPEEKKEKEEEVKVDADAKEAQKAGAKKEAPKPEEKEKEVKIDSAKEASKPEAKKEAPKPKKEELPQQQKIKCFQRFLSSVKVIEGGTSCADIGMCNADFTQILLARLCNSDSKGVRETAGASNYGLKRCLPKCLGRHHSKHCFKRLTLMFCIAPTVSLQSETFEAMHGSAV
jgi:hypothetical protein